MRWRTRRLRAAIILQKGDWPVLLCLGPGLTLEMNAAEAKRLALDLADAVEQTQRETEQP
jgi:hypothetical protein